MTMHEYVQIKYSIFKHFSLMPFIYLLIPTQILTFYFVLKTLIWLFSKQIFPLLLFVAYVLPREVEGAI